MPATDPRVKLGDDDADALTADVRATDPAADTPGLVVRIAGTLPASALPSGAATSAAQTDGSQRTGVLGADGSGIASAANPLPVNEGSTTGALSNTTLALVTAATIYNLASATSRVVTIRNTSSTAYVYTGGSAVSAANAAIKLGPGQAVSYAVANANQIYATADTNNTTLAIEIMP